MSNAVNLRIRVLSPALSSTSPSSLTSSGTGPAAAAAPGLNGSVDLPASLSVVSPLASPTGKPMYRVQPYGTVALLKRAIAARVDALHARALVPSSPDSVSLVFSGRVLADDELLGQAFARFLPDVADFSASDIHPDDPLVLTVHALIRSPLASIAAGSGLTGSSSSVSFSSRLSDAFATNTVLFASQPAGPSSAAVSPTPSSSWTPSSGPIPGSASSFSTPSSGTAATLPRPRFTSTPASFGGTVPPASAVFVPSTTPSPPTVPAQPVAAPVAPSSPLESTPPSSTSTAAHPNPLVAQWHDYYNDYYRHYYTTQLQALLAANAPAAAVASGVAASEGATLRHRAVPGDAPLAPAAPTEPVAARPAQRSLFARGLIRVTHALVPPVRPRANQPPVDPMVHARAVVRAVVFALFKWAIVRQVLFGRSPGMQPYLDLLMVLGVMASAGIVDVAGVWRRIAAWLVTPRVAPAPAPVDPREVEGGAADPGTPAAAAADPPAPGTRGAGALAVVASFFVSMVPGSHPLDPATSAAEHLRAMDAFEEQEAGVAAAAAARVR